MVGEVMLLGVAYKGKASFAHSCNVLKFEMPMAWKLHLYYKLRSI